MKQIPGSQRLNVRGWEGLPADPPVTSLDLFDNDPRRTRPRRHHDRLRRENAANRHRVALVVVCAQHCARFIAGGSKTSIQLDARRLLDRAERDQLM
jgi:hypothetical protein